MKKVIILEEEEFEYYQALEKSHEELLNKLEEAQDDPNKLQEIVKELFY